MLTDLDQRNLDMARQIAEATGDYRSGAYWLKLAKECDHQFLHTKLSELKEAMAEQDIVNPGAYLTAMIKGNE